MFSEFENLEKIEVLREDGMVDYYPHFLDLDQSTALFQKISSSEKFEQNDILLFGKRVKVPRLEAYYALNGEAYGYSGQALTVQLFPSYLNELRLQVQEKTKSQFNALLINYYRDGQDSNGWHADNEKSLGEEPNIASLSLGAVRRFELKHMANGIKKNILLANGSLLHMHGQLQKQYKNQLPKIKGLQQARLNLTFRWVRPSV
jgi:alkylated DNA repair dioxygenase AlkB